MVMYVRYFYEVLFKYYIQYLLGLFTVNLF